MGFFFCFNFIPSKVFNTLPKLSYGMGFQMSNNKLQFTYKICFKLSESIVVMENIKFYILKVLKNIIIWLS